MKQLWLGLFLPNSFLSISLHSRLNPLLSLLSMLLNLGRVLGQLLHLMRIWNMSPLLYPRSSKHPIIPRLQSREFVDVDTSPECGSDPSPMSNIGDGALVADKVTGGGFLEVGVQDPVEAPGLVDVAVYTVFDAFGRIAVEVISLALPEILC